jgi:hypothetical protein
MARQATVIHWIWNLSLGGDAKNLCALASAQSKWAQVIVLVRSAEAGVRIGELAASGVSVVSGIDSADAVNRLRLAGGEIVVMHRNGRPDEVETQVLKAFNRAGSSCFEFNTFGRPDPSTEKLWAGHFFPSRSCLAKYAARLGTSPLALERHVATGCALSIPSAISVEERATARGALRLSEDDFVIVRLLRPDLRKWDPMPVVAAQRLLAAGAKIKFIVQSAPPERFRWIRRKLGDAAILLEPTNDEGTLRQTLAAADCLVNCSHIGETFGFALAEGMACGLPPIVNSTPEMDNAQVELVTHELNGLVANSISELATSIERLMKDPSLKSSLGLSARDYIASTFSVELVEQRIRQAFRYLLPEQSEARELLPPNDINGDGYRMDEQWLREMDRRGTPITHSGAQHYARPNDDFYLRWLRSFDTLDYALSLGPAEMMAAAARRLGRQSFKRL